MVKLLSLFSGYGTDNFALKQLGMDFELIGYSDIDKYANQCFQQNHGGIELGDVTKIDPHTLEDFDLLTGGFPCQSFSCAGKGLGELDSRGTLFHEIIRIAEIKKPRHMLLENVKGLTFKKHKPTFDKIISELYHIGYFVKWQILNTKDYGIPQNRERIFFACFKYWNDFCKFKFPEKEELTIFLKDILEEEVDEKYFLSEMAVNGLIKSNYNERQPQDINKWCSTLKVGGDKKCININQLNKNTKWVEKRIYGINGISPSLTCTNNTKILTEKNKLIRKLTPKECFRLQGFLNDEINLDGLSNCQRYKLAGNGQSVNVVRNIFKEIYNGI